MVDRSTYLLRFGERRLLEQARNLLVAELALARSVKEAKVLKDFEKLLGAPV